MELSAFASGIKFWTLVSVISLSHCSALSSQADTRLHPGGIMKSNANTEVDVDIAIGHWRGKRQAALTGSRISQQEANTLLDLHNDKRRQEYASDMKVMVSL